MQNIKFCGQLLITVTEFQILTLRELLENDEVFIGLDKAPFSINKYWYFSYFSTNTYVVVLIRSA